MRGTGRNSEKRRERSKVAARDRRSKESEIFSELSQYLPLPEQTRNALDKASVMRLSLSDLKLRTMMEKVFSSQINKITSINTGSAKVDNLVLEMESLLNNAMGGFLLVLSTEGDIIYVSESVTTHLGLSQVEVMGLNIYDFSHPCDHADIKDLLVVSKKDGNEDDDATRSSSFRMKCTITERGRNVHIRAATYKVIDFTGRMLAGTGKNDESWFVGIGEPLLHPSDVDIPLNKQTFLTKHSPDMKCEFVDDSIMTFLGYRPEDLIGKSIFEFYHASDGPGLAKSFKSLYVKGQSITERYRFLAKHGGWVWVITQATLIQSNGGIKPNSVVCLNFITSGIENENEIVSCIQREQPACKPFKVTIPDFKNPRFVSNSTKTEVEKIRHEEIIGKENILPIIPASNPVPSTTKIFAPRTEDMDTGFLMPCDNTLIVSKEEPEDLTHLAPIAGDESVPLDLPLLDNLLQSFDGNNIKYSMNGYMIDVNLDDLPPLEEPFPKFTNELDESSSSPQLSLEPEMDEKDNVARGSPMSLSASPSPLFLQSDPHMVSSPGSKSSLLSPFQQPEYSPGVRSDKYDFRSPSPSTTIDLQSSPYDDNGGGSTCDDSRSSSVPGLISLNLQEESNQSAVLQDHPWNGIGNRVINAPSPSSISRSGDIQRNCGQTVLNFASDGGTSKFNNSNVLAELPVYDSTFQTVPVTVENDLLWQNDFNLVNNVNCDNFQFLFESDTLNQGYSINNKLTNANNKPSIHSYSNTEQQTLNSSFPSRCTNRIFDGIMKNGVGDGKSWLGNSSGDSALIDNRSRDHVSNMVSQKRPHQLLDVKQEVNENFSPSCYTSEHRLAKQPKLAHQITTTSLTSGGNTNMNLRNGLSNVAKCKISNAGPYVFGDGGGGGERKADGRILIGNNLTSTNNSHAYTPMRDNSNIARFSGESKLSPGPTTTAAAQNTNATSFTEVDLKAYVQSLLSSGRSDIINELLTELSNYRKEYITKQAVADNINSYPESRVVEPPYSNAGNDKSSFSSKLKLENTEKTANNLALASNSVLAIVGLCDLSPTPTDALTELTVIDCEVNAPANEGSSHLNASELVKDLDKDNPIDSFV